MNSNDPTLLLIVLLQIWFVVLGLGSKWRENRDTDLVVLDHYDRDLRLF
jgi:hypothetical protein